MDMFRRDGLGSYRDLLVELAKNPGMIYWLDNNYNHKDQPNENRGRELLDLLGVKVLTPESHSGSPACLVRRTFCLDS